MKKIQFILLIINFFFSIQNSGIKQSLNETLKNPKIKCGVDNIKSKYEIYKLTEEEKKKIESKRRLQDEYQTIRIYVSNNWINSQIEMERENADLLKKVFEYLNKVIEYIQKLIQVKPLQYDIQISYAKQKDWKVCKSSDDYDKDLEAGVSYDLVIFPIYSQNDETSCEILDIDGFTKRPIISVLNIPYNLIKKTGTHSIFYIESLLLHEFTHILGFLNSTFEYFPNGYNSTVQKISHRERERYFIVTKKVSDLAKEYFGCNSVPGLELEDQDSNDFPSSHWEARILLGEYMNLEQYTPEVVMSDFTLALLEDSGWYKANYYTGGLMRFGKKKGCSFLNEECSSSKGITNFKNEFFDIEDVGNPSCSSGRLSRAYCDAYEYTTGIPITEYNRITIPEKVNFGGKTKNADYCFGFIQDNNEETNNNIYVGNCNFGNGNYGSKITYNQAGKQTNGENQNELGEKYSDISFCILSEAFPTSANRNKYLGVIHPMCYEMICSNKTLTIKIKNQYIVCPRGGGKVEVNGDFQGYIYCPDYNLICTGSVLCNDMFDCIDKKSTSKIPNYEGYTVTGDTSSQKISKLKNLETILAYELEDGATCPINCAQCKDGKKCYKCRENYNLIGERENDDNPIICNNTINISVGYFEKNDVYYPCIEYCNVCTNSDTCTTCDNYHKLNNGNRECIEKIENCLSYNNADFTCLRCKEGYAFLKQDKENCYNYFNTENYFTLDNGISYYPYDTNISNCDICNNFSDRCSKCKQNYYFLGNNRTFCFSSTDLSKYYSRDDGISYILCNSTITQCDTCTYSNGNLKCDYCQNGFYFIEDNRDNCYNNLDLSKYYSEDGGKSYYPCNSEAFPNCEICNNNKNKCEKCVTDFYFIGLNKLKCETAADLDKYYTEDNITYMPCDTYMEGCETCANRSYCLSCKADYYFVERQRNRCFYKINLESFYKEGDAYFYCNKSVEFCNKCRVKGECTECNSGFYFIGNNRTYCDYGRNLKKYYTNDNGISYFPCDTNIENCDECYNENFCYLCKHLYFLKYENSRQCFLEEELISDKTYYRCNATHYRKCSENILNCNFCSSSQECDQCISNYYFVNDDRTQCINIVNIDIEEYFQYDKYNYHICSWLVEKCKKCNSTICNFCQENYTLVNDNYKKCFPKADYQTGYYLNPKGNMYYPCIDNCDKCENSNECLECSINYSLLGDGTSCGACTIAVVNVDDELSMENIDKLVQSYINNYRKTYDVAMVYTNPSLNITLTVFRTWQCTDLLLTDKYYRISIAEFIDKLKKKMNKSGSSFVFSMLNYNYKSYFEVYDVDLDRKIDLRNECPECLRVEYEIKNDYSSEITHFLGNKLSKMVNKYNINVLNSSDPNFHDICRNVEIESIDLSIEERRSILYLGNDLKKITCLDDDCTLNSVFYNESTGYCTCKFNFDFEKLINNSTSTNNEYTEYDPNENQEVFEPVSGINPLPVFLCSQEAFSRKNIVSNEGLYIGLIALVIQIIAFIIVLANYCGRKKMIKNIASPPPKDILTIKKKTLVKDDTEKETQLKDKDYDSYFDGADSEKKIQDRDEDELSDEIENNEDIRANKYYNNTQILSEENSFDSDRKNDIFSSQRKMNDFNFEEKMNPDEAVNNFSRISEIKKKPTEELDYSNLSKKSSNKSLDLSEDEIFTLVKDNKEKLDLDYIALSEAVKKDERTILELYTHLLALKQPIWDMLSDIKALQINKSFVPLGMKIIRFVFMFCFNMFLNSLFLTQKYFKKKFNYFNDKYNIKYNENTSSISSNEKFAYALKNTIVFSVSTFIICLFIQFIINYCFFNLRRKIWIILKECDDNKKEEIKEMNMFFNHQNFIYIIIACVDFILIIFFFFYLINFSQAYKGGILDYVGATFMTWLFLQVIPFISCIISALFRYYGLKNNNNRLYKLNQIYIY